MGIEHSHDDSTCSTYHWNNEACPIVIVTVQLGHNRITGYVPPAAFAKGQMASSLRYLSLEVGALCSALLWSVMCTSRLAL